MLGRMLGYICGSGMFAAGLLDRHVEAFERIRDAYPWNASAAVSSHNDPNPRNFVFDGARLWLIDWETAYRNEPLVDVAILLDQFGGTPECEQALVGAWSGSAADESVRLRLVLMRPLTRLYYACLLFAASAAAPRTAPDSDLSAPTPDEFRHALGTGRMKAGAPETTYTLGKMLLAGFLAGADAPDFERALMAAR
jgi:Ser/Thr protein kinase RdoA (MazF antagonist)